ncbi:MAG: hypothetical protein ACRERD_07215 [Candidatus Binatia bacterium]
METMTGNTLLVGSIPLASAEEVFRTCGRLLGDRLSSLPDGEVGDRTFWITYVAYHTYHGHPQITTVQRPAPPQWKPTSMDDVWAFKLKDGVTQLRFDKLGYADDAITSYQIFRKVRAAGDIPPHVRMQFAFPFPQDATFLFFRDPADHSAVMAAYEEVLSRELATICKEIPAEDLAIQWDVCTDLLEMTGRYYAWSRPDTAWERYTGPLSRLPRQVPDKALLGFHFCYGTFPQKPALDPIDLSLSVKFANAAVADSGRRVDYVHMTVPMSHSEDAYFQPLRDLKVGDTKVYLGLVNVDGMEATKKRLATARKYLANFGVAAECGFGREKPENIPGILQMHRAVADELL